MSLIMYQDLVDDCSVACIPESGSVRAVGSQFVSKENPFAYNGNNLVIAAGAGIPIYDGETWHEVINREAFTVTPASLLDTGESLEYGCDYYGYICLDSGKPAVVFSKNTTYPSGSTANTSRKFCGFHYGAVRKVSDDGLWIPIDSSGNKFGSSGTKWQDNVTDGIVPNSVWDLIHRPKTLHPAMAEVGGKWLGIYQASAEESFSFMDDTNGLHIKSGKLTTKYGAIPVTGTEGMNQFTFNEAAARLGLRLPRYSEWLAGAFGSHQGEDGSNNYGWTATTNTARTYTGCRVNTGTGAHDSASGVKPYAVSAFNLCDCAGNIWEWAGDYSGRQDSTNWTWYDNLGSNMGQADLSCSDGLGAVRCGGDWSDGVHCGARTVGMSDTPWHVNVDTGVRLACDGRA